MNDNPAQSAKNLAQQVAKQMVNEPWEILKQAGRQVAGTEIAAVPVGESSGKPVALQENEKILAGRDRVRCERLIQALETELKEIAAVRKTKKPDEAPPPPAQPEPLVEVSTKPGRKFPHIFGGGRKVQAERQQTQTERPLPPSG